MAWTAPRTWIDGEVPTAALLNTHLRDNLAILKTIRDASGKLSALDSTTLADLSAANLTEIAHAAAANSFTAGRSRFNQGASVRFVLPVGADKYTGVKGSSTAKGTWVETDYLHHIAQDGATEWRYLGTVVSTPAGAVAGSAWVEGAELHYVDASGVERACIFAGSTAVHTDGAALGGGVWVETYLHWIQESGIVEVPGHADVTHSDHSDHADTPHTDAHSDTHGDTAHADVAHVDSHADHTDVGHSDGHADSHTDTAHSDSHSDTHSDVSHADGTPHSDIAADSRPVVVP